METRPDAGRAARLRRNPLMLFWKSFFQNGSFLNPVLALFFISRGIAEKDIFLLGVVYGVTVALFELPTGYLADRIGRRRALLIGVFFMAACGFLQVWAAGFFALALVRIFMGISESFDSGIEEALVVDSARELEEPEHVLKNASIGRSGRHVMKFLVPIVFAGAAFFWIDATLYIRMAWLVAIVSACALIPTFFLTEPKHGGVVSFREGFLPFRRHPILWIFTIHDGVRFTASIMFFWAYTVYLEKLGATPLWLGICYAFFHLGLFVHERIAWRLDKKYGAPRVVNVLTLLAMISGILAIVVHEVYIAGAITACAIIFTSARESYYVEHVNAFIPSSTRATTLSIMNIFKRFIDIPALLLAWWCTGRFGISSVFFIFVGLNLLLLVVRFPSLRKIEEAKDGS